MQFFACPFPFEDMNSARANLGELDKLIESDSIAIIGAGGTGSYIFDLVSKTNCTFDESVKTI